MSEHNDRPSTDALFDAFLDRIENGRLSVGDGSGEYSKTTKSTYKSSIRVFKEWLDQYDTHVLDVPHDSIEGASLAQFKRDRFNNGMSDKTVSANVTAIRLLYQWFIATDGVPVDDDPSENLSWPSGDTRQAEETEQYPEVTENELEQLCENVPVPKTRNRLLFRLMWWCGFRASEAASIRIESIEREKRLITVENAKTGGERTVPYPTDVRPLMTRWLDHGRRSRFLSAADSPYLFVSRKSGSMNASIINNAVKTAAENAGIQTTMYTDAAGQERKYITSHAFRHSAAKNMIRDGLSLPFVRDVLGHDDIDMTLNYLRDMEDEAVDELKRLWAGDGTVDATEMDYGASGRRMRRR